MTRSADPSSSGRGIRLSAFSARMQLHPSLPACSRMAPIFFSEISKARITPSFFMSMQAVKLFPPGAAHASITVIPGVGPAAITASAEAVSWTYPHPPARRFAAASVITGV